jgi:hypothetical protein
MGIPNLAFNEMTQNKPLRWLGRLLRLGHYLLAVIMILWTIAGPTVYLPYLVSFWPLMLIANYWWGCFLTRWEMRLTGENMTVIDPPLLLFGYDYSNKNRKILTLVIGLVMLLVGSLRCLWFG